MIALVVAFFGVADLLVRGCRRVVDRRSDENAKERE